VLGAFVFACQIQCGQEREEGRGRSTVRERRGGGEGERGRERRARRARRSRRGASLD
jgi:hypothetical protein